MASGQSVFLRDRILNFLFNGGAAVTVPASLWLRLYTTALTAAGVGTEVAAASYDPVEIELNTDNFPTTTNGVIKNDLQIPMGTAEEDWGTLAGWGLWTAQTGGNLWRFGEIDPGIEIGEGAVVVIPAETLIISDLNEA